MTEEGVMRAVHELEALIGETGRKVDYLDMLDENPKAAAPLLRNTLLK